MGALLVWAFLEGRKELVSEQEQERPIKAPSRVLIQDGESIVILDQPTQIKSGIAVVSLQPISHQEEIKTYGTVMETQDLIDLYNSYIAARAKVEKTKASLNASGREYERLKSLHEKNRDISDKVFQAAEATWRSDESDARAAQDALHIIEASVRQQWGTVITRWLIESSPVFNQLMQRQCLLIQITLPKGVHLKSAPQTALVQTVENTLVSAELVSPSPHTDPRIQGMSFFYTSTQTAKLLPKMNVIAYLPFGSQVQGVVVPDSAVVWWQGKAWVYVQRGSDRFIRREISTETPINDGWFLLKGLAAGDRIVVIGSQLLLSEESRSQIQIGD